MWTVQEAKEVYKGKIDEEILDQYKDADRYAYINEWDEDLQKFRIELPEPPRWNLIEGFGKDPFDQVFTYEEYPYVLKTLAMKVRKDVESHPKKDESYFLKEKRIKDTVISTLEREPNYYDDEIQWIKDQWYHRIHGKWYFINGKPTYINGWNFFYLNYWKLNMPENKGRPEYRMRDRLWFHTLKYTYTTTETIDYKVIKTDDGVKREVQLLEDGTPKMIDLGSRTLFGTNSMKGRRVGDSSKGQCVEFCIGSENFGAINGIQGDTAKTAEDDIYKDLFLYAFKEIPFFFQPELPNFNFAKQMNFTSNKFKGGLGSKIVPATTADKSFFDGAKLTMYIGEEVAKVVNTIDIKERHNVVIKCMSPGIHINGLMLYASTVENMSGSGKQFERFSMQSMFEERGADGRTKTGMINSFFPYQYSMEGFIDKWGDPIIGIPREDQVEFLGFKQYDDDGNLMGADAYIKFREQQYIDDDDFEGLASYQRKHPSSFRKCFALASMNRIFNSKKLQDRLVELKFNREKKVIRGDFHWTDGFHSPVKFVEDEDNGRFLVSEQPELGKISQVANNYGSRMPAFKDVYIACADPFKVDKTDSWRVSDGGGAVLKKYNPLVDGNDKSVRDWSTKKFVCTYKFRPDTKDEYAEDMLKMCIYYGALMYPENNIDLISESFIRWGYKGYLLYDVDTSKTPHKMKQNAGFTTAGTGGVKIKLFNLVRDYVNVHVERCDHPEIIQEILEIPGPDQMKDFDLFVCIAGCLAAEESTYVQYVYDINKDKVDVSGFW
jgi:hypothetical protein